GRVSLGRVSPREGFARQGFAPGGFRSAGFRPGRVSLGRVSPRPVSQPGYTSAKPQRSRNGSPVARRLFTSESVTEGHPDKMADQISDAILDSMIKDDPDSHVAVETLITTGQVHVAGEVSTET